MRSSRQRWWGAVLMWAWAVPAAPADAPASVTAVRFWSADQSTRVAIELSAPAEYRSERIGSPDRLFFDVKAAKATEGSARRQLTLPVGDATLRQIRVAHTQPGVTRVVLDLQGDVAYTTSTLERPFRIIVELRSKASAPAVISQTPKAPEPKGPQTQAAPQPQTAEVKRPVSRPVSELPAAPVAIARRPDLLPPAKPSATEPEPKPPVKAPEAPPKATKAVEREAEAAVAARRTTTTGDRTLARVLGLKLGRIVLDPGHGGHDTGANGFGGLTEKELVLDVAQRLKEMIEGRMGSEVVLTREDDTFIPLEERTQIANRVQADLFVSIHANSSPSRSATGMETFYLNFTTDRDSLDVAARENATSGRGVGELRDLLQKIALNDKVNESRELAAHVQQSLQGHYTKNVVRGGRNRGVKKAPFVVLIGAAMPAVLAEVGFISNAREEGLMKRPEYRQKLAESLYKGLTGYANTLARFQKAERDGVGQQVAQRRGGEVPSGRE